MSKSLSQILSDGTLVDNRSYRVAGAKFWAGYQSEAVEIDDRNGVRSTYKAWRFMTKVSAELNERLRSEERSKLVIFSADDYEHNTQDDFLQMHATEGHSNFSFCTGNLIGCVSGVAEGYSYTLRVSSRFGDEFLKYIIADADGFVELPDHGGMGKGGYEWLLIYLWVIKLKKAFRLGLPKSYESRTESLTQVRGRLDPVDYYLNRERARYSCTYREHSYDNPATRLIARTLEHLDAGSNLRDCHNLNQTFQTATAGSHHPLQSLLAAPHVRNPYYADYNPVMTLAKRILRNDLADFGNKDQTSAFFFDVSMLFEYFIRKLLRRAGCSLRDKSSSRMPISPGLPGVIRRLEPDLVFEYGGRDFVFDVKYKNFQFGGPSPGVDRTDLFQLHTYVGQASNHSNVAGCGFIYPIRESRWHDTGLDTSGGVWTSTIMQGGREILFHVAFLMVPEQGTTPKSEWPSVFQNRFRKSIETFVQAISDRLHPSISLRDQKKYELSYA